MGKREPLLSLHALAPLVGLPVSSLRKAAASRAFPTVRLTGQGRYRATLSAVQGWLDRQTVPAVERHTLDFSDLVPPGTADERLM